MYSFSYLEPVCCSTSSSNCCFLTCIQVSQEAGQVVWLITLCRVTPETFDIMMTVTDACVLSRVWLFVMPWMVACQALLSMGFSRQEYCSGLPFSSPGYLPNSEIKPRSRILQADTLPSEPPREFQINIYFCFINYAKALIVWITINCGKFWKRWEYQTTWPASWETYMQVRKQQLELDIEQQTGSK